MRFSNEAMLETLGCVVIIIPPCHRSAGMALVVKNPPASAGDVGREDPLEEGMAINSSILAWRMPWRKEPTVHGVTKESDMT